MVTRVVHCKRSAYDILIDRTTRMGNPFILGRDGTRAEVIEKYREWAPKQPWFRGTMKLIKGKVLGCWCAPKPCHGDILAEFADVETELWQT